MRATVSLDLLVKSRLKGWGQRPPGVKPRRGKESWLRGRPSEDETRISSPFLKIPGSSRLRTLPDGLWLNFGGTFAEPFVGYPGDRGLQHHSEPARQAVPLRTQHPFDDVPVPD